VENSTTVTEEQIDAIVQEWERLAAAKWREIRHSKGHFISRHSPQWTMAADKDRRKETRHDLMRFAEQWFAERGVQVRCVPDTDNTDGFDIESVE
jgi:hypothetical protein